MTTATGGAPLYRPCFPDAYRPGVGIVGCGGIVKLAHLTAYTTYGVDVVGVYDPAASATDGIRDRYPIVGRVFETLDELLDDPRIEIVDVATHPTERLELMRRALAAGKHVLSQKPFALDAGAARELVEEADRRGLRLAVNQNGRWAPAWRVATLLVQQGAVGDVCAVTHLYEHDFGWTVGDWPDALEHFVIYDFSAHWIDITRCWLDGKTPAAARALEYRTPGQPAESTAPWGAWIVFDYEDGSSAAIRSVGRKRSVPAIRSGSTAPKGRFAAASAREPISSSSSAARPSPGTPSKATGFPTASRERWASSAARSPRIASPSTRGVTTCCRWR